MGDFDRAARYASQADTEVVPRRLLADSGLTLTFREWLDTRTLPLPTGADRTADLVAAMSDSDGGPPWLIVLEMQAQEDTEKLDVTLEEVAILRSRVRHGEDRKGKYKVAAGMVYLCGRCPKVVVDMTFPSGAGTRHQALVWNVEDDDATRTLDAVTAGESSWGILFWLPLMAGGGEEAVIARWKEVVSGTVPDRRTRDNLAGIALVFAELVGRRPAWDRGLEGFDMMESQVVREWVNKGRAEGELKTQRKNLLEVLEDRFPGAAPNEVIKLIEHQESFDLLHDWFREANRAPSFEHFMGVLRR